MDDFDYKRYSLGRIQDMGSLDYKWVQSLARLSTGAQILATVYGESRARMLYTINRIYGQDD